MKKLNKIQRDITLKTLIAIFNVIKEKNRPILKSAEIAIIKDYALIIFDEKFCFQYKWNTKEILCVNGLAKSISYDYLKYSGAFVTMNDAEKLIKFNGFLCFDRNKSENGFLF